MISNLSWKEFWAMARTWLQWKEGRQKTGYDSLLLFLNPFLVPFHVLILRFPEGSRIPPHKDRAKGFRHYRLNFLIKSAKKGGQFITEGSIYQSKYVNFFRSDICKHEVTKIEEGSRYVFSIGWILS